MRRIVRSLIALCAGVLALAVLIHWRPAGFATPATLDRIEAGAATWALWTLGIYASAAVTAAAATTLACVERTIVPRIPRHAAWLVRLLAGGGAMSVALFAGAPPAAAVSTSPPDPLDWAATRPLAVAPASDVVVVRAGDTLWAIAARALDTRNPATIAANWRRWYATNATVIGANPNHIVPGQRLARPASPFRRS